MFYFERKSVRLKGHDYAGPGVYFVTFLVKFREHLLGQIKDGTILLSEAGEIVRDEWLKSFQIRNELVCHEYIIMPNHIHAILEIIGKDLDDQSSDDSREVFRMKPRSLSSFIAGLKWVTTLKIRKLPKFSGIILWHRGYHDHLVRSKMEMKNIGEYIRNNLKNWDQDEHYC